MVLRRVAARKGEPWRRCKVARECSPAICCEFEKTASVHIRANEADDLRFVATQAAGARWIFAICTGLLLLGAAGLLQGRRAGGHWLAHDLLSQFGAINANGHEQRFRAFSLMWERHDPP